MDLHFTHYDEKVLKKMLANNIIPLFVPAGCTDCIQECDTVLNKTFKSGVKNAFRDYLHGLFDAYRVDHPAAEVAIWSPSLAMSVLKPQMVGFVEMGIAMISIVVFQETIRTAFKNDGMFELIREQAIAAGPLLTTMPAVQELVDDTIKDAAASNDDAFDFVLALPTDLDEADVNDDIYEDSESDSDSSDED